MIDFKMCGMEIALSRPAVTLSLVGVLESPATVIAGCATMPSSRGIIMVGASLLNEQTCVRKFDRCSSEGGIEGARAASDKS